MTEAEARSLYAELGAARDHALSVALGKGWRPDQQANATSKRLLAWDGRVGYTRSVWNTIPAAYHWFLWPPQKFAQMMVNEYHYYAGLPDPIGDDFNSVATQAHKDATLAVLTPVIAELTAFAATEFHP